MTSEHLSPEAEALGRLVARTVKAMPSGLPAGTIVFAGRQIPPTEAETARIRAEAETLDPHPVFSLHLDPEGL